MFSTPEGVELMFAWFRLFFLFAALFVQSVDPEPASEVRQWPMERAAMLLGTTEFSVGFLLVYVCGFWQQILIWLVVWNMTFIFPYIGNNHPN